MTTNSITNVVVKNSDLEYNTLVVDLYTNICPGGLMDKVVDSGSTDAGSIPVRDAKVDRPIFNFG